MKTLLTSLLTYICGFGITTLAILAYVAWEKMPSYQRVSTLLAQEADPPTQNADDSLGGLLNEETAPKTTADENAPPRSILAQIFDSLSDEEFVTYLGLTGETAERLDKEEADFVKTIQSNPKPYEAHLHEAIAKHAAITRQSLADTFGENWASLVDTNHFAVQMSIYHEAEQEALRRTKKGELTDKQQEEANMKKLLARERENYQRLTDSVAHYQDSIWADREKRYPHVEKYKYKRMKSELRLAQRRAEFELHRPLWVHLGFLPEDETNKQDKTLQYADLISMAARFGREAQKKRQELWDAADPKLRAWITAENAKHAAVEDRIETLANENEAELDRWLTLWVRDFDFLASIAMDDAKFALWRASVNESAAPPAQNPGDLLPDDTTPAPVTNTDDNEETSPTPAPSPGSEEETNSGGSLGDDASPGNPTVPGGLE